LLQAVSINKAFGETAEAFIDAAARDNMEEVKKHYQLLTQHGKSRTWLISAAAKVAIVHGSLNTFFHLIKLKDFKIRSVHLIRSIGTMLYVALRIESKECYDETLPALVEKYKPVLSFINGKLIAKSKTSLNEKNRDELAFIRRHYIPTESSEQWGSKAYRQAVAVARGYLEKYLQ